MLCQCCNGVNLRDSSGEYRDVSGIAPKGEKRKHPHMISPRVLPLLCLLFTGSVLAADHPTEAMRLWTGKAPDALGDDDKDIPTLTPYWPAPELASGAAFI